MNKKTLKIITIISTVVAILSVFSFSYAFADPSAVTATETTAFDTVGSKIIGALRAIGILISVGVLVVLGIKYMMGSAQEKAEYKKTMIPYLIGAVLIFAATQIAGMVYQFANTK